MTYRTFDGKTTDGVARVHRKHGDGPHDRAETREVRAERFLAGCTDLLPLRKVR